jgi:hypothetical protein
MDFKKILQLSCKILDDNLAGEYWEDALKPIGSFL